MKKLNMFNPQKKVIANIDKIIQLKFLIILNILNNH